MKKRASQKRATETSTKLTRAKVIRAGLEIVRTDTPEDLTMRSVAKHLGCGTMSLYYHVKNREDLLQGMLDQVAEDMDHPPVLSDPVQELLGIFMLLHATFHREPWVIDLIIGGTRGSERILPLIERALAAFDALGLDARTGWQTYHMTLDYCVGEAMVARARHEARQRAATAKTAPQPPLPDAKDFPYCMTAMGFMQEGRNIFQVNLARFLENTAAAHHSNRSQTSDKG
ncbi:MAG: TetR/AcrR family transcriptional regulator [Pseudomonadota bacterium]